MPPVALMAEGTQPARTKSIRYPALDALRGLALISMVASHVGLPNEPTNIQLAFHSAVWIDGAFYFVALSGVVTGLVHRRIIMSRGVGPSAVKLARRAGFIYLVQLFLVVATITVASVDSGAQVFRTPTWSSFDSVGRAIADLLLLKIEPNFTGVLSMYVLFLLLAIPAVAALARGWWWAVVGGSIGIYALGAALGGYTFAGWDTSFDPFGWQLLFVGGLLVGWSWEFERVSVPAGWWKRILITSAALFVVMFAAARLRRDQAEELLGSAISKFNGGWLAFVMAAAVLVVGYAVLTWVRQFDIARKPLAGIEVLGSKGLPGYVAMVLSILVVSMMPWFPRRDLTVVLVVIVCGFAEWGAVRFDRHRKARAAAAKAVDRGDVVPSSPPVVSTPVAPLPPAPATLGSSVKRADRPSS